MSNRLSRENSLYLRKHKDNPVNWFPWCSEAFKKAQSLNRPIILSIGYSACHWCNVMMKESFSNQYIADLMNQHFICIKIDREERPDIDQIYMEAIQMINKQGGWPLNAFCLPDGRPFFGGTYFPNKDVGNGIIPWPQLLMRISNYYINNPKQLIKNADNIVHNLNYNNLPINVKDKDLDNELLLTAANSICKTFDNVWGGFGVAPKFPSTMILEFLLAIRSTKLCEEDLNNQLAIMIDKGINTTLTRMAYGGLFDQIGGGFSRYSIDRQWRIPHFEKMLYDNSLLLDIYTKSWLYYRNPLYIDIIYETIKWIKKEMIDSNNLFYSSIHSESNGIEGGYYTWTLEEIYSILGKIEGKNFCEAYLITKEGNFKDGFSQPNFVHKLYQERTKLKFSKKKLLQVRQKRTINKDKKHLISWNALIINTFSEAGFYLNEKNWIIIAKKAFDTIWNYYENNNNQLNSIYHDNKPQNNAYLTDYAYMVTAAISLGGKIDWVIPGISKIYYKYAEILMNQIFKNFFDSKEVGFFFTKNDHEKLITRKKDWFDNAYPSGNSSIIHGLSSLFALTGKSIYINFLKKLQKAYPVFAKDIPNAISYALSAYTQQRTGIAVVRVNNIKNLDPLQKALSLKNWRKTLIKSVVNNKKSSEYELYINYHFIHCSKNLQEITDLI